MQAKKSNATPKEVGPTGKPKRKEDQPKKVKLRDQKSIPVPQSEFAGRRKKRDSDEEDESEEDDGVDDMMDLGEEDEGIDASFLARMNESDLKR